MAAGRFVWIDLDAGDPAEARRLLSGWACVGEDVVDLALRDEPSTQYGRHDDYLHLVVSGYRQRGDDFELERVSVTLGERFLLTIHRGRSQFLDGVRRDYHSDFVRFAKTPSFLLYEIWDHLIDELPRRAEASWASGSSACRSELRADDVDDGVFARVSELGADLLHFRKVLLPARAVLDRSLAPAARCAQRGDAARSSPTWSAPSTTSCRTCWSTATSSPSR